MALFVCLFLSILLLSSDLFEANKPDNPVTVTQTTPSGSNSYIGRDGDVTLYAPEPDAK